MKKKETVQLQLYLTKNSNYNRLARKIVIANLGGPVKRRIKCMKGKEGKYFKLP